MAQIPVYLDNNATTRTDPHVIQAMTPFFTEQYGNAASRTHIFGHRAETAVEEGRARVARLIGASPREIVFTSGATESDNLALKGAARMLRCKGNHVITVATEHRAVLDSCRRLEREGFRVTYLPVDEFGRVSAEQVAAALTDRTILVSVMAANNEIGTLQPIGEIGRVCKERGVLFHTDAVQAVGKVPLDVEAMAVDLLSLTAHKIYGPKGVGALFVRQHNPLVQLEPLFDGGGHERGIRSGTLPVPLVVGFGVACELCLQEMGTEPERLRGLRERLRQAIMSGLEAVSLNGHPAERLPNNLNLSFSGVEGRTVALKLKSVALSSGSACTSANSAPSHVLKALGIPDDAAHSSLRFGVGRFNTEEDVDFVATEVVRVIRQLRAANPLYKVPGGSCPMQA